MVELGLHRAQACFDIAQAFAIGQLRERQTKKLIPARKAAQFMVTVITSHTFSEFVDWKLIHQLCEDGPAKVHASLSKTRGRPLDHQNHHSKFKSINLQIALNPLIPNDLSDITQTVAGH